jgi:hypothetical protein
MMCLKLKMETAGPQDISTVRLPGKTHLDTPNKQYNGYVTHL